MHVTVTGYKEFRRVIIHPWMWSSTPSSIHSGGNSNTLDIRQSTLSLKIEEDDDNWQRRWNWWAPIVSLNPTLFCCDQIEVSPSRSEVCFCHLCRRWNSLYLFWYTKRCRFDRLFFLLSICLARNLCETLAGGGAKGMMAASTSSLGAEAAPNLAWKWILEKLVDLPAFGLTFIKGIGSNPSSLYLQHCRPLRITLVC